jgi:hypothetical protein
VSVAEDMTTENISVYPNPAVAQQFVNICAVSENANYSNEKPEIFNIFGMTQTPQMTKLDSGYQMEINNLAQGIYFIKYCGQITKFTIVK